MIKLIKPFFVLAMIAIVFVQGSYAQLTGININPGSYATLTAAISDYRRINSYNNYGWSLYNAHWNFTTTYSAFAVPVQINPANNSTGNLLKLSLVWSKLQFSTRYNVVLASDTGFTKIVINDSTLTDTLKEITNLDPLTTYYWKVRGKSDTTWGDFSPVWKFTTRGRIFYIATNGNDTATGTINDPFKKIQSGVNSSINGDTVIIGEGVYNEKVIIENKYIHLGSYYLLTGDTTKIRKTIIDGNNNGVPLSVNSSSKIYGITLRKGTAGLVTGSDSVLLKNLVIRENNVSFYYASGIMSSTKYLTIDGCTIEDNNGINVHAMYSCINNDINEGCKIINSIIRNNSGGVCMDGSPAYVNNCLFYNNRQPGLSMSYHWSFTSVTKVNNCTFFNNGENQINTGHIFVDFKNLILWGSGDYQIKDYLLSGATVINIENCLIKGGESGIQTRATTILNYANSNINVYPQFADTSGKDFRINDFSPAIGEGTSAGATSTDFFGNPRPSPAGSNPDMGAFENARAHFKLLTPALITPGNGSINLTISFGINWSRIYGATKYRVQISNDNQFSGGLWLDTTITDTTRFISNLLHDTTYYWRVQSIYPYDTSAWSETWNFKTIVDTPDVTVLSNPLKNAGNIKILPILKWNKTPRATNYTLEVSTDSTFVTITFRDTSLTDTAKQIGPLSNFTRYYWRVNARNIGGTGPWSERWNFITTPANPVLVSPQNNSIGNLVSPTLHWNQVTGATKYHLQVAQDSLFTQLAFNDSVISETQKTVENLEQLTFYYWRVRAGNNDGYGEYSQAWKFKTKGTPALVIAVYPAQNSINIPVELTFKWSKAAEQVTKVRNSRTESSKDAPDAILKYKFELAADSLFSNIVTSDSTLTDSTKTISGLENFTYYYWRIKAKNETGWGEFNEVSRFQTIIDTPNVVTLSFPENNSVNLNTISDFKWLKSDRVEKYSFELSTDSNFYSVFLRDTSLTDTIKQVMGLNFNTRYYWRVSARNIGGVSPWSQKWNLTTTIANPVLISPLNNSIGNLPNPTLKWNSVSGAAYYNLIVAKDSLFNQIIYNDSNILGTQTNLTGLELLTFYYWKVRAGNTNGNGGFSSYWKFKTKGVPVNISLIYPSNNAVNIPINFTFKWQKGVDQTSLLGEMDKKKGKIKAINSTIQDEIKYLKQKDKNSLSEYMDDFPDVISNYWFELVTDTLNMTNLVCDTSLADTSKSISGLTNYTNYYWRVKAKNEAGWNNFSAWNVFRTIIQAPSAIVLSQPSNNATGQNSTINFSWRKELIAEKYFIQVSTDSLFNILTYSDSTLSVNDTIKTLGPLQYNKTYYWRVRGSNIGGIGAYSPVWKFQTMVSGMVQLISPANGSINQLLNPTLNWNTEPTATSYQLQVSTDTNFVSLIYNSDTLTTTSKQISGLDLNTQYFWRVRAKSGILYGPYSNRWYFVTLLPVPNIISIGAGNSQIFFSWSISPSNNIKMFRIYRGTSSPATTLVDSVAGNVSNYTNSGLNNNVTYYYRITSVNYFNGESSFSNEKYATPFNLSPVCAQLRDTTFYNEGRLLLRNLTFLSNTSYDPDGTIDSTLWYINGVYASNSQNLTYNFPQGLNTVKLIVVDNNGAKDSSSAIVKRAVFMKNFPGQLYAGLSMAGDSILYAFVSGDKVYRMDIDGNIKYYLAVGGNILSSSSISNDTSVFIGSSDNNLYAFSKNGIALWPILPLGGQLSATPTLDSLTNKIFIGSANNNFQAINKSSGNVVWSYTADAPIRHSAVITNTRKLIFTTVNGTIYGFNVDNLTSYPIWVVNTNSDTISTSPAIDNQGYFYVGTKSGYIKKISMQAGYPGLVVWSSYLGGSINASPIIDANGKIYVGSTNGNFYKLNRANGFIESPFPFQTGSPINTTAAMSPTGRIYFGNQAGEVYAIDTLKNLKWYYKDSTSIGNAILYKKGTIYLGTTGGKVLSFYDNAENILTTNPLSNLPLMWGTYQGNNRRTGSQLDVINPEPLSLNLKVYLEGMWDGTSHIIDTITVYLAKSTVPFSFVDSVKVLVSSSGTAVPVFTRALSGNYYIVIQHRNHLQTWSANPQTFIAGTPLVYDFTTAATQAYGSNMKQVGSVWVLFGGDANQDGDISALDVPIFTSQFGMQGYLAADFNGDGDVNGLDAAILVANFGLSRIIPVFDNVVVNPTPEVIKQKREEIQKQINDKIQQSKNKQWFDKNRQEGKKNSGSKN